MIIDNFLSDFERLRIYSLVCEFTDQKSPVDGVIYPLICMDIPVDIEAAILNRLELALGRPAENPFMFMRQSPKGTPVPHEVHSDKSMGKFSLMLYIQNHPDGGTSFLHHKESGIAFNPKSQELVDIVVADQNNRDAWVIDEKAQMVENRGVLFEADRLHRAEPPGGFGEGEEARVVLTCFFS